MAKAGKPRSGSMQFWPRKKAKKQTARVRKYPEVSKPKLLGFAGYKAGMTHAIITGQDKNKVNAGQDTFTPVTIIECPPMKIASLRLYNGEKLTKQFNFKSEKELARKTKLGKKLATKEDLEKINVSDYTHARVQIYTIPKLSKLKKTPELMEMAIGGNLQEQIDYVKERFDKPITVKDVFSEGSLIDTHAVTIGKGFQGPLKRFGIGRTSHKSEKARRNPGSLGGWSAQAHVMYRVPHAGQTGYHLRTQYNNQILKIDDKPENINPKGGLVRYGLVNTEYILVKGSVQGPKKRLITMVEPMRAVKVPKHSSDSIKHISRESQQ